MKRTTLLATQSSGQSFSQFPGNAARTRATYVCIHVPHVLLTFAFLFPCCAVPNAERDSLLFYRELADDHTVPDWSCGHDHAEDAQEGYQHLQ